MAALSSISAPFIRRPVATTLLMFGLLLAGITGYRDLPVSALPQVDYPTIVVTTQLPGASAQTIAESVTTPLERQLGQVPALAEMTSVSSYGSSRITLQFSLDRDIDAAEQDVQAAINAASNLLPRTLPSAPTYAKSNPADQPILTLAVSSHTLDLPVVSDYADSVLAQKISQVDGVGLVTFGGGQKPAVRVQVDPVALAGTGLTLEDVRAAIAAANVNLPKGNIDGPRQDYAIATNDQLTSADAFKPLIVAYRPGQPGGHGGVVRLGEVADVIDSVEDAQLAAWANRRRAVILSVQRQPGANIIEVANDIKELLPRLRASMPQGIDVDIMSDRTTTVRASVEDVQFTLLLTVVLVVAVIYLFLGSLRATVIPGVAVPLALIGTFGVMWLVGYSLNNLSLMALTISTGFIVDDAIVMVENVARHVEEGERPYDAALKGAKQIGFTIVSLTVSLIAVLIPLLFMGGLVGRLFREFAVTLAIAIAISAVLSLTLTAMMSAWVLRPRPVHAPGTIAHGFEAMFAAVTRFYERTLTVVLRHRYLTLGVTLATAAATLVLAIVVPKGFFPVEDTGMIAGVSEAEPGVSFTKLRDRQDKLIDALLDDPAVATITSSIGADGINPAANVGRFSISLVPLDERDSLDVVIGRLQQRAHAVPGITAYLQPVQDLQVDARVTRTQFQYTLEDADERSLAELAPKLLDKLRASPELANVASDRQGDGLQLQLVVDRDTASRLGITADALDQTLYDAFGQRIVSTTFTQLNQYRVILEVRPRDRTSATALDKLYVRSSSGSTVPLSQLARWEHRPAPLAIAHQGQFSSVTISFDPAPDASLGEAVDAIEHAMSDLDPPPTMRASFTGAAKVFGESLESTPFLILAALITVYIVLGVLYESYIHPLTILSTLPSAGVGAILALYIVGDPFDVIALIGIVLLIGIVQKNAIMMIDFALAAERERGLSPEAAIYEACRLRFRPIMMTTMAALLGGLPLALGTGMGSELRRPLGITIVGGLLLSQVLTLYTTPVVYLFTNKLRKKTAPPEPMPVSSP